MIKSQDFKFFQDNLLNFISVLTLLIPISLISGPFIPDLFLSISSIIFLIFCIKNNCLDFFKLKFFYLSVIFYLLILISAITSENIYISIKSVGFYFRFIIFSISLYFIFSQNLKLLNTFFKIILFSSLIIIFDSFVQFIFGYNLFGFQLLIQNSDIRVTSFFGDDLKLGSYLARFLPFFIYSLLILNLKKFNILKIIFITLYTIVIFLTGERTAILFALLSLLFLTIFLKDKEFKKYLFLAISILSLSIITILNTNHNLKKRVVTQTLNQVLNKDRPENLKLESDKSRKIMAFSYIHDQHYQTGIKIFKDNILLGSGPKTFRFLCKNKEYKVGPDSCSTHPHNTYIQLLSETGLFSFVFIISIFFYFLYLVIKELFFKKKSFVNNLQVCMVCCILINLWPFSPSGNFFNNWLNIIYFLPVGFYILSQSKKKII